MSKTNNDASFSTDAASELERNLIEVYVDECNYVKAVMLIAYSNTHNFNWLIDTYCISAADKLKLFDSALKLELLRGVK